MPQGATPVSLRMQALAAARFDDTFLRTSPSQFMFTKTYGITAPRALLYSSIHSPVSTLELLTKGKIERT